MVSKPPQMQASELAVWTDHLPAKGPDGAELMKIEMDIDTEREELNKREFATDLVTARRGPIVCETYSHRPPLPPTIAAAGATTTGH